MNKSVIVNSLEVLKANLIAFEHAMFLLPKFKKVNLSLNLLIRSFINMLGK